MLKRFQLLELTVAFHFVSGATVEKIATGGWLPLTFAGILSIILLSYHLGHITAGQAEAKVSDHMLGVKQPIQAVSAFEEFPPVEERFQGLLTAIAPLKAIREANVSSLQKERPASPKILSVFLTTDVARVPLALVHMVNTINIFPSQVLLLQIEFLRKPYAGRNRVTILNSAAHNGPSWLSAAVIRVGFAERNELNIARYVEQFVVPAISQVETTLHFYVTDREFSVDPKRPLYTRFFLQVYMWLALNSYRISRYFHLPLNQTIEIGVSVPL
jgi:K+ transporter